MSADQIASLITGGLSGGAVLALWVWMMATGKLHSDDEFQREVKRGDLKDQVIDQKDKTIAEKDRAIAVANERAETSDKRAEAAVKSSEIIAHALAEAGQRRSRVPKAPTGA